MIKAFIFDLGGVLVNTPTSLGVETYRKEIKRNESVVNLAKQIKNKGIKIAILSNTIPEHVAILQDLKIFENFDELIFSYQVNLKKPDIKIFKLALERLGTTPDETVSIDDNSDYVKAAKSLGMHGIVFSDINTLKKDLENLGISFLR